MNPRVRNPVSHQENVAELHVSMLPGSTPRCEDYSRTRESRQGVAALYRGV
jgi:hypothetical protein